MDSNSDETSQSHIVNCFCFSNSRDCLIHSFVLTFSSFIFVTSMFLTVYLTSHAAQDKIAMLMVVVSCVLYLLCFVSNMYSVYHCSPICIPYKRRSSNHENRIRDSAIESCSSDEQPPDIMDIIHARGHLRKTPYSPRSAQTSKASTVLSSNPSTTKESQIEKETQKMIRRMFEAVESNDQEVRMTSRNEHVMQQVARNSPLQQEMAILRQNLTINKQQIAEDDIRCGKQSSAYFYKKQGSQTISNLMPDRSQLDMCTQGDDSLALGPSSPKTHPLQTSSGTKSRQTRFPEEYVYVVNDYNDQGNASEFVQEPITSRANFHQMPDSAEFHCICEEYDDSFERSRSASSFVSEPGTTQDQRNRYVMNASNPTLSVSSSVSEPGPVRHLRNRYFMNSSNPTLSVASCASEPGCSSRKQRDRGYWTSKLRRQLSALSTKKLYDLNQSPSTVVDAIGTCYDLSTDEWMVAWRLGLQGVPPEERARILGVRLSEN